MKYKVLIVDDEEPARKLLLNYAEKIDELEVVDVLNNALDAKRLLNQENVDILLTDIQMDDLTGIDLVKTLKNPPVTIFTTAYSEYALEGFDLDIADYLVKPISFQRFCKAIDKTTELIKFQRQVEAPASPMLSSPNPSAAPYFFVKTNRKMVKVAYADILFVESYGEYVKIYTQDDVILALQTTSFMEQLLPAEDFIRIHRSHIINMNQIVEIDGNTVCIDQHRLTVSKRLRERFMEMVRGKGVI
ncbi:MAG: LytTR family DNA-binding domain-containing protein [Bacteroidota bacterium]